MAGAAALQHLFLARRTDHHDGGSTGFADLVRAGQQLPGGSDMRPGYPRSRRSNVQISRPRRAALNTMSR